MGEQLAEAIARHGASRIAAAGAMVVLVTLLGLGLCRRAEARGEPFWIGTRTATVFLGDAPCDFLAWENMAWECSMRRDGPRGALPDGLEVAGHRAPGMLLIPTGLRRSDPRIVRWENVPRRCSQDDRSAPAGRAVRPMTTDADRRRHQRSGKSAS